MDLSFRELEEQNLILDHDIEQLQDELNWWRTYGEYVSKVHTNIDAEACGYADGDNEYKENFN
jgi:hypothetical protein